jgi:hypothetical protein
MAEKVRYRVEENRPHTASRGSGLVPSAAEGSLGKYIALLKNQRTVERIGKETR